jgi:tetratricopeptide (TPR) repeat protein
LKSFYKYLIFICCVSLCSTSIYAQKSNTKNKKIENTKLPQQIHLDSLKNASKLRADSIADLKKYRESKGYKDSIAHLRQLRLDSIADERTRIMDSIRRVRQYEQDSIKNIFLEQKKQNDSLNAIKKAEAEQNRLHRQHISDSLASIRAYKQTKTYKDSVAVVRQEKMDSLKAIRTAYNDSIRIAQRKILDSLSTERKRVSDSMRTAQKTINDSLRTERLRVADSMRTYMETVRTEMARQRDSAMAARKVISDSLAKIREERAKAREVAVKENEKKKSLALEIKFENEKKAFTNEKHRKKKWTATRKIIQNTFTRYNYFFNANQKLEQAEENMRRSKKDNYDEIIDLFPFNPDIDSAKLKSDMDTLIQKTSLGIQLHDPRGKWQDDLYLIMGQAYYYKGDYENAANAFKFIVHEAEKERKEKLKKDAKAKKDPSIQNQLAENDPSGINGLIKHTSAKNKAILWLARTMVKQKLFTTAVLLLDMMKNDANFPKNLRAQLELEYANLALENNKISEALPHLEYVLNSNDMDKYTRQRAGFIMAKILQQQNKLEESSKAFEEVVSLHPNLEMDFKARMNIVTNSLNSETQNNGIFNTLQKMSKDQKFKPYFDQIYYGLGKHYEYNNEIKKAEEYYTKSIRENGSNATQKGMSFVALGDILYNQNDHIAAAKNYDSAIQNLTSFDEPYFTHASMRTDKLYNLATPAEQVRITDSILYLASLTEIEQKKYIDNYLKQLEKEQIAAYYLSQKAPEVTSSNNNNANKSWYFANPSLMQKGAQDFKQKWPNRELKDNWRRSNLGNAGFSEDNSIITENLTPEELIRKNLPSADSLFLAIPKDAKILDSISLVRKTNLFNQGKIYFSQLEDYNNTHKSFQKLDSLYPNNEYIPETYHIKYLIALRTHEQDKANEYLNYLKNNYPNSNWTTMLLTNNSDDASSSSNIDEHYDDCYNLVMNGDHANGKIKTEEAYKIFPTLGDYKKKYDILRIISNAGLKDYNTASKQVDEWLSIYAKDSLKDYVLAIKKYINDAKNYQDTINKIDATLNNLENDENTADEVNNTNEQTEQAKFTIPQASSKHYVIIVAPLDNKLQGLRAGISEMNRVTNGYENKIITLNGLTSDKSILLIREFDNKTDAKSYMNKLKNTSQLFVEYSNDMSQIKILPISVENYPKLLSSKDINGYIIFQNKHY